jgi:L-lactate dehydrogenase (cytochrome)
VTLRQRVLRDMSSVDLGTRLLGHDLSMPLLLGPVGFAGMLARRGEVQAARAARAAGLPFVLSTVGVCSAAEVTRDADGPPWFQLYMIRDRGFMRDLLQRVSALGSPVLVLTVDLPVPGTRYRDIRSGLNQRPGVASNLRRLWQGISHPSWLRDVQVGGKPLSFGNLEGACDGADSIPGMWTWIQQNFDPSVTWRDLDFIRQHWSGPVVIKGILDPGDARTAVSEGADAIVVSNHGGRQLDSAASSITALPAIAEAVARRIPVLMDGGVRSGLDVLKAITLGADACLIGRAWAYALAGGGEDGVTRMLASFRDELRAAMILIGCTSIATARG